jgi:2-polyprenyl-6-hydroxyphenyl methylase/3-demethylubiquinone-9 3-methyltransferase
MPADNQIYDRLAETWWDSQGILHVIRTGLNPVRFGYAQHVLEREGWTDLSGIRALDIGCGGGLLAEEFAGLGCDVAGIDPSHPSVEVAIAHALRSGLSIDYSVAAGEAIPFADATFDLVYCCDVLEHVSDVDRVVAETARVLKPNGLYIYDTLNRTLASRFVAVTLLEQWLDLAPRGLHDADQFIRPSELRRMMKKHGLQHLETRGIVPGIGPLKTARGLWNLKRGAITYPELGRRLRLRTGWNQSVSYIGYGVRLGG